MSGLEFAISRLRAFLDEVERLTESEFPYAHSRVALEKIHELFQGKLNRLKEFHEDSDPGAVEQYCKLSLTALFQYVPLLGFILRSTNVRNAFEIFGPVLRLARDVLEHDLKKEKRTTRLILSSEWDYSPFVYHGIPDLRGFVLIGFPSPESSNPLLIPLAGHELGHSLWARRGMKKSFRSTVKNNILTVIRERWEEFKHVYPSEKKLIPADLTGNMFCVRYWEQAIPWTLRQAEESFCDFVGIRVFGEAYLNAFAYLMAPGTTGPRSLEYPNMKTRVVNMEQAARAWGVSVPDGYAALFDDWEEPNIIESDRFRLSVADSALARILKDLIERAGGEIDAAGVAVPLGEDSKRILGRFEHMVPAEHCKSIANILNAAWQAHQKADLWEDKPQIKKHRDRILRELVLKNIEVFEIEQIPPETS